VVTKLDRLARSLPDARAIAEELTIREVSLSMAARCMTQPTPSEG
jgi:DNA invertase Pin-like site-specific DNA recombinase